MHNIFHKFVKKCKSDPKYTKTLSLECKKTPIDERKKPTY